MELARGISSPLEWILEVLSQLAPHRLPRVGHAGHREAHERLRHGLHGHGAEDPGPAM